MSETITFKCPNCGGGLKFDPEKQKYDCEYCLSEFTQTELESLSPKTARDQTIREEPIPEELIKETPASAAKQASGPSAAADSASAVLYTCPSCGAQIVTDETTAATFCYYCHNPVILSGRLKGEYHPDYVIPFAIDREKAENVFTNWMKKKRYVPKAFYTQEQIQKISGVYFPYLMYSCEVDGGLEAKGTRVRVWVSGNMQYTETQTYDVSRKGIMDVNHVVRGALKKANRELVEGILPYDMKKLEPFSMGYLSGFVAERRDMEKVDFSEEVKNEVRQFARDSLRNSVNGYDSVTVGQSQANLLNERWDYALLPVWTLTYHDQAKDTMYYFTINGQNGRVCGKLPVDKKKLFLLFVEIFLPVLLLMLLMGYFI